MSIQDEIDRLTVAKSSLKASIENKGVEVSDGATLSDYSSYVDEIATIDEDDFVKKTGDTMTGALTVGANTGEALRATRVLSGITRRIYVGLRNDGDGNLNGQIEALTTGVFSERTGLHLRRDGIYQLVDGESAKLATSDEVKNPGAGITIPIPARNFVDDAGNALNQWTGIRLEHRDASNVLTSRLWLGMSDDSTVGQIEFWKQNDGLTALRFKPDGLYQKVDGVESKLGTSGGGTTYVTTHVADIEFYEGYGTTLEYRLLDYSNDLGLDTNSIYLVEFTIFGDLQVDSGSANNFEYHLKGILNKGSWTQTQGYQVVRTYVFDYIGTDEYVTPREDNVSLDEYGIYFWIGIYNISNADMAYEYLQTTYAKASFTKIG